MQVACATYSVYPTLTSLSTLSGRRAIPTCQRRRPDSVNIFFIVLSNFFSVFDEFGTRFVDTLFRERERERRVQLGIMNQELGEREISPPDTSEFRKRLIKDVLSFPTFGKYVSRMFCYFRLSESTFQGCFAVSEKQKQPLQKKNK